MRTLLAAVALLLLVAPGCGDDTTTSNDLAVTHDLSVPADMLQILCKNAFSCGSACFTKPDQIACATGCAAGLNTISQAKYLGLVQCVLGHCSEDGGDITLECGVAQISSSDAGTGPCFAAYTACNADTGK